MFSTTYVVKFFDRVPGGKLRWHDSCFFCTSLSLKLQPKSPLILNPEFPGVTGQRPLAYRPKAVSLRRPPWAVNKGLGKGIEKGLKSPIDTGGELG
jgi:hypothetical protein